MRVGEQAEEWKTYESTQKDLNHEQRMNVWNINDLFEGRPLLNRFFLSQDAFATTYLPDLGDYKSNKRGFIRNTHAFLKNTFWPFPKSRSLATSGASRSLAFLVRKVGLCDSPLGDHGSDVRPG